MSVYEYIIGAVLIIFALLIIVVIILQEGRQSNMGVISGSTDSFMDRNDAKTKDRMLAKWTKIVAIVFFVLAFGGMLVTKFLSTAALEKAKDTSDVPTSSATETEDSGETSIEESIEESMTEDTDNETEFPEDGDSEVAE